MSVGDELLVEGWRIRYGLVGVGRCGGRTRPLKDAQVDLRTLDGTLCAAPGGALIGQAIEPARNHQPSNPLRGALLTLRDSRGKAYETRTDAQGIYQLQHLPPDSYGLDSKLNSEQYILGGGVVAVGKFRNRTRACPAFLSWDG